MRVVITERRNYLKCDICDRESEGRRMKAKAIWRAGLFGWEVKDSGQIIYSVLLAPTKNGNEEIEGIEQMVLEFRREEKFFVAICDSGKQCGKETQSSGWFIGTGKVKGIMICPECRGRHPH